jgi:hypothetical protein
MNNLSDPRRSVYFDQNLGTGVYEGGPYGENNSFSSYTHVSSIVTDPTTSIFIRLRRSKLYLAELNVLFQEPCFSSFGNKGITASFEQ